MQTHVRNEKEVIHRNTEKKMSKMKYSEEDDDLRILHLFMH